MAKQSMKKSAKKSPKPRQQRPSQFGPVTRINTAPVSIGNTVRGSKPIVTNSANGCRVVGRDFAFECKATVAAANSWNLVGGMPITPAVLATSSLKSYSQMFSNFKINRLVVHYITSSPTSQAGDIMFYYERERNSPMIDFTNNSFLPFVLSDPMTVIGPQWQNNSMMIEPVKEFKNTNYGLNSDLNEESAGSIFIFSKTNSASSPGYVLIDFDITFKEMCVNPRAGIIPITRGLWNYMTFSRLTTAVTAGNIVQTVLGGVNPDGTSSSNPSGLQNGDVYKCIALLTASTVAGVNAAWVGTTPADFLAYDGPVTDGTATVDDGFTFYIVATTSAQSWYMNLEGAKNSSSTGRLVYGVTATITVNLCCLVSYVGSVNSNLQASY